MASNNGWDAFARIIAERKISANKIATDLGFHSALFSDWKRGKSKPKADKLLKIAEYLNVPIETFIGEGQIPVLPLSEDDMARIALLGGLDSVSDAGWEEIKAYAQFVKSREQINNK